MALVTRGLPRAPREDRPSPVAAAELVDSCCIIVFTDISGSTALIEALGDEAAAELFDFHTQLVRRAIERHGGLEIRSRGDGFVIAFRSVKNALRFSLWVRAALDEHNASGLPSLRIRTGVHAGEPVTIREELQGVMLHKAARIAASAEPAEILVSDVIRQLAEGKGFAFTERGEVALRGLAEPVRLHALDGHRTGAPLARVTHGALPDATNGTSNGTGNGASNGRAPRVVPGDDPLDHTRGPGHTILVTYEQPIMREGLAALLEREDDLQVVGAFGTVHEALAPAPQEGPDVLVMGVRTAPDALVSDAVADVARVRKELPRTRIVAIADATDRESMRRLLQAGVRGYLVARCAPADLVRTVRAVAQGGTFLEPCSARALLESLAPGDPLFASLPALTDREHQILQLVAEGYSTRAIARRLGVASKTILSHRSSLRRKLGAQNTADLVRYAVGRGVVRAEA